jgi:putative exosortase-associated protein (TIGR04073 family)
MKTYFTAIAMSAMFAFSAASLHGETSNFGPTVSSADCKKNTASGRDGSKEKAENGIKNVLFGWTDIPRSIIDVTRESCNPVWGIAGGTFKGVGKALPRTVSGISDIMSSAAGNCDKPSVRPDELKTQLR